MNRLIFRSAVVFAIGISATAYAGTVVTGGRCTQRQLSNKLTSCETSTFTNSAGQTGYKCTCTDKFVAVNPDRVENIRVRNAPEIQPR